MNSRTESNFQRGSLIFPNLKLYLKLYFIHIQNRINGRSNSNGTDLTSAQPLREPLTLFFFFMLADLFLLIFMKTENNPIELISGTSILCFLPQPGTQAHGRDTGRHCRSIFSASDCLRKRASQKVSHPKVCTVLSLIFLHPHGLWALPPPP